MAIKKSKKPAAKSTARTTKTARPSREEAMKAVKTLIAWAGDNPEREGLIDTPKRVVEAYRDFFAGYDQDPKDVLSRFFEEVEGYDEMVLIKNIRLESHCEHHMVPFIGMAHVAYIPNKKVIGLSKIPKLVDIFAKRLQTQETLTAQIADALDKAMTPRGVAVVVDAKHQCMTCRGVHKTEGSTITSQMRGLFRSDPKTRTEFMGFITSPVTGYV
jgi:GTP cyclohydrolase I